VKIPERATQLEPDLCVWRKCHLWRTGLGHSL